LQKYETTKLFWDNYLYKLEIRNRLGSCFRGKNLSYARQELDSMQRDYEEGLPLVISKRLREEPIKEQDFLDAKKLLTFFSKCDEYLLRIEGSSLCIYSNDEVWINKIASTVQSVALWEPKDINLEPNVIIVEESNGYEYKVTLGQKLNGRSFGLWAQKNPNQIKLGPVLLEELLIDGYVNNLYFYARDQKTLQLCELMLDNIRRVDKLVVKSNIDK